MNRLTTLLLSALLLLPLPAIAAPFGFTVGAGDGGAEIGPSGLVADAFGFMAPPEVITGARLPFRVPRITLTAGPPLSIEPVIRGVDLFTIYTFASIDADIRIEWRATDGTLHSGLLHVPVVATNGFGVPDATPPQVQIVVCETPATIFGCSFAMEEGAHTQDDFFFGPGMFDRIVARALGVRRETAGGDFNFYLEAITGDATSPIRFGSLNAPSLSIEGIDVPEPALLVMLGLGLTAAARRYRNSRAR